MNNIQQEILQKLSHFKYKTNPRNVFEDAIVYNVLILWSMYNQASKQECSKIYNSIIFHYTDRENTIFTEICKLNLELATMLSAKYHDYFGELYTALGGGQHDREYIRSYDNSLKFAEKQPLPVKDPSGYFIINEPFCGTGGDVLATVENMLNKNICTRNEIIVDASETDFVLTCICYFQMVFAKIPAVVTQRNYFSSDEAKCAFLTPCIIADKEFGKEKIKLITNKRKRGL